MQPVIRQSLVLAALLAAGTVAFGAADTGPTPQGAVAADQTIATAMLANNADQLAPLLAADWAVINTQGGIGTRDDMLGGIRSGGFTRKTLTLSNPRVRLYGNVALVTTHVATSGQLDHKDFDVQETQTDVLVWKDGVWTSVLLHETKYGRT
ncbi:MAG: nuclear transport factor 2 family protein [Candidatus Aquilonibacter sp.]